MQSNSKPAVWTQDFDKTARKTMVDLVVSALDSGILTDRQIKRLHTAATRQLP